MSAPPDERSVGELLLESEQQVRDLLHDAPDRSGLGLAQGWVEVVGAASELWRALPVDEGADATWGARERPVDLMDQLQQSASSVQKRIERAATGQGRFTAPVDDALVDVAGLYFRAGDLVQAYTGRSAGGAVPAEVVADADAARSRIMHTVYVTSHAVTVALGADLSRDGRKFNFPLGPVVDAQRRIGACEQIAGTYVQKTYPVALNGEHRDPVQQDRFANALSAWDVAAHRHLAQTPTAATLSLVARQEMINAQQQQTLWRIAAETGHVDESQYRTRLSPGLEDLQGSWDRTTRMWESLRPRTGGMAPQELRVAATELRAATRELIHDRSAPADPELVASRTDLGVLVPRLHNSLATSVELAHAFRDVSASTTIQVAPKPTMAMQNERLGSMPFPNARWASQEQARSEGGTPLAALQRPNTPLPAVLVPVVRGLAQSSARAATQAMGAATGIEGNGRTDALVGRGPDDVRWGPGRQDVTKTGIERLRTAGGLTHSPAIDGPSR